MSNAGRENYEQLLALRQAIQLRRSLRNESVPPPPRRPDDYPERHADQALMVESLETIRSAAHEVVRSFYVQLFDGRPHLRAMFPENLEPASDRLFSALIGLAEALGRITELVPVLEQLGRDHRKYGIRASHYDALRDALIGALREHSGPAWRPDYERAWARGYDFAAQVMQSAEVAATEPPFWHATVTAHERRYPDIAVVRVRTDHPFRYRAGQYTTIEVPEFPRRWRPYSMATAPGRGDHRTLEFHVRAHPHSQVAMALVERTRDGDRLRLGTPMGTAVLDPRGTADLLVVAGGTGLAPCRAVTEDVLANQPDRRVRLIFGARRGAELYDLRALTDLAERHPRLTLVPVATDQADYPGLTGPLPDLIGSTGPWQEHEVYLCGPPAMVRAVKKVLTKQGVPSTSIHHDPITR